jgi:uncharacterized OB-fold protein
MTQIACNPLKDDQDVRAKAAQRINQLMGVTDDDPVLRWRSVIHNAAETGSQCAKCARVIAPNEPIWRAAMSLGQSPFGGWRRKRHEVRKLARRARPCGTCGKTFEPIRADAKFCCIACKQAGYRRRRVADRVLRSVTENGNRNAGEGGTR